MTISWLEAVAPSQRRVYDYLNKLLQQGKHRTFSVYNMCCDNAGFFGRRYVLEREAPGQRLIFVGEDIANRKGFNFALFRPEGNVAHRELTTLAYVDTDFKSKIRIGMVQGTNPEHHQVMLFGVDYKKFMTGIDAYSENLSLSRNQDFYEPTLEEIRK